MQKLSWNTFNYREEAKAEKAARENSVETENNITQVDVTNGQKTAGGELPAANTRGDDDNKSPTSADEPKVHVDKRNDKQSYIDYGHLNARGGVHNKEDADSHPYAQILNDTDAHKVIVNVMDDQDSGIVINIQGAANKYLAASTTKQKADALKELKALVNDNQAHFPHIFQTYPAVAGDLKAVFDKEAGDQECDALNAKVASYKSEADKKRNAQEVGK